MTKHDMLELGSLDLEIRRKAIYRLRGTRSRKALQAIIAALDDPETQYAAVSVLADRKDALAAVPKLVSLLKSPSVKIVVAALRALAEMHAREAVDAIAELLNSDDEHMRGLTAAVLGEIGDSRAFESLLHALHNAGSEEERLTIWDAIGSIGCAESVRPLTHLIETPNLSVLPSERRALVESCFEGSRRLSSEQAEKIASDIAELSSADPNVRAGAISRLGSRRGRVIVKLAEASASPNILVRYGALFALQQIGDPRAYPIVLEMTKDPVPDIRWWALQILGEIGKEKAVPVLAEVLQDSTRIEDRMGALDGMQAVGDTAVPVLTKLLNTADKELKMMLAATLGSIAGVSALPVISELLNDEDADVRISAIEIISAIALEKLETAGGECLGLIEAMQGDRDDRVRAAATSGYEALREEMV